MTPLLFLNKHFSCFSQIRSDFCQIFVSIISTYFDMFEASCSIQSLSIHQGVPREDRHGDHDAEHRSHQRVEGRQDPDADHGAHLKVPGLRKTGRVTVFRHEKHMDRTDRTDRTHRTHRTDRTKISDTSRVSGIRSFSAFCFTSNHSNPSIFLPSATIGYHRVCASEMRWCQMGSQTCDTSRETRPSN